MTKSWVSGGKSSEGIERLRTEIAELEAKREALLEKNKRRVFDWVSYVFSSPGAPKDLDGLRKNVEAQDLAETIALYELLNQQLMDKEASLGEKLDEQARYDSLG